MKKVLATSMLFLFASGFSFAQQNEAGHYCGTYEHRDQIFTMYPEMEDAYYAHRLLMNSKMENPNKSGEKAVTYRIPVVFHILHQYGTENISDAQVYDAMRVINEEFNSADPDSVNVLPPYDGLIGDGNIEFVLAAVDPFGNCTNGIEHIYTHESFIGDAFSKVNQWNRSRYLNIWVIAQVDLGGAAAYATQPASTDGTGFWLDGVVAWNTYVGSTGTSNPGVEHVLTHEIGHYLSLDHVWGGTNEPEVACGDDGVPDTPLTKGQSPGYPCNSQHPYGWVECGTDEIIDSLDWYTFDSITPGAIDATPAPAPENSETTLPGLDFSNFAAVGVGSSPMAVGSFGFNGWDTGALDGELVYANLTGSLNAGQYYEFTVQPVYGQTMTLNSVLFDISRDMDGPRTYAVRSSVDGYASNLSASLSTSNPDLSVQSPSVYFINNDTNTMEVGSRVTFSGPSYETESPITFRIYAWNAESTSGYFTVDNVRVAGEFGLIEDVQNYMNYSYCNYHYTPNQIDFMRNALNEIAGQRNNLWQDSTLMLTGVEGQSLPQSDVTVPLCAPIADFTTASKTICVGENMDFEDASYNAKIDSWSWTFQDGTPSTSTSQNPTVSFNSSGYKTVTLTVSNAAGSGTETRTQCIYVTNGWGDFSGPTSIDMENGWVDWFIVNNPEDNYAKFALANGKGYNQSRAWKLNNYRDISNADPFTDLAFYYNRLGLSQDELISPSFDLRYTSGAQVSFKFAYATNATQEAQITENIKAYVSDNCGETWTFRMLSVDGSPVGSGGLTGSDLVTGGYAGYTDYAPTTNQEWATATFTSSSTSEHFRFKLVYEASDLSSNLYIDDINLTGTVSLTSDEIVLMDLNVFPNPTGNGQSINVSYEAQDEPVSFTLRDAQGKVIAVQTINETNTMVNQALKGTNDLGSGCYFLEVNAGEHSTTRKVVVL
jgi:PKD repeat protein